MQILDIKPTITIAYYLAEDSTADASAWQDCLEKSYMMTEGMIIASSGWQ